MEIEVLQPLFDKCIRLSHKIGDEFSKKLDEEIENKCIKNVNDNKMLNVMYSVLQDTYDDLEEKIIELIEQQVEKEDETSAEFIFTKQINQSKLVRKDEIVEAIINEMREYVTNVYLDCKYINPDNLEEDKGMSDYGFTQSIYEGTRYELLRLAEYEQILQNLYSVRNRIQILNNNQNELYLGQNNIVINWNNGKKMVELGVKHYTRVINNYQNIEDVNITPDTKDLMMEQLYIFKNIVEYSKLNEEYLGLVRENDEGLLGFIREAYNNQMLHVMLNISKNELEQIENLDKDDYKSNIKNTIMQLTQKSTKISLAQKRGIKFSKESNTIDEKYAEAVEFLYKNKKVKSDKYDLEK